MDTRRLDEPLVIEKVSFSKEASSELPLDESQWVLAITQEAHEQIPSLQGHNFEVKINKTDSERGFGYGTVVGENFNIPVIIKEGRLMPLDVFIDSDGRTWPTAGGYFDKYLAGGTDAYGKLQTGKPHARALSMFDRMNSPDYPHGTNRNYGSTGGYVQETPIFSHDKSLTAKLEKSEEEVTKLADTLRAEPGIAVSYRENKTEEVLKVALTKTAATSEQPVAASPERDKDDAFIIEAGKSPQRITKSGVYIVKSTKGTPLKASVLADIIGFDLKKKDFLIATRLRKEDKSYQDGYALQPEIAGYFVADLDECECPIGYGSGDGFGCFVYDKKGKTLILEPVKRLGVITFEKEEKTQMYSGEYKDLDETEVTRKYKVRECLVQDMMGRQFKVYTSPFYNGVTEKNGDYYINEDFRFKKLDNEKVTLHSDPSMLMKSTIAQKEANPVVIKMAGSIVSADAPWASNALREGMFVKNAKEELGKYYTADSIESVIKVASEEKRVLINQPRKFQESIEAEKKASSKLDALAEKMPRFDTVKVAAALTDPDTVDSVLALNFLNKANIAKFVEYAPALKNALTKISDLLLASRIGLKIPPAPIKTAMDALAETLSFIENLDAEGETNVSDS